MGRKRKLGKDPEPYLVQHEPLSVEQLSRIFDSDDEAVPRAVVSHVTSPKAGQVFLVECAGARFARYDVHRWTSYHKHDGLGALFPDGMEDSFGDMIEVRYNKKRGSHTNLCDGAVRIVYKFKTDAAFHDMKCHERNIRVRYKVKSDAGFHVVQYMEKLPNDLEEKIKQDQEMQNAKLKKVEEMIKKEKDAELAEKEAQESQIAASSFGRRRKPNSRYLDLYKVELSTEKHHISDEEKSENDYEEEDENEEDSYGESFDTPGMSSTRGFLRGRRGRPPKGRGRGSRHRNKIWMAGYGLEKTKPKSSSLFRMCDDDDEQDDDEIIEGINIEVDSYEFDRDIERRDGNSDIEMKCEENENEDLWQLISYSMDIPSPVTTSESVLSVAEITDLIDRILHGKLCIHTSAALLPKVGDLFVLKDDIGADDGEMWIPSSNYPQGTHLSITWYERTRSVEICHNLDGKDPDVKLIYKANLHPQFCLVHYLSTGSAGVEQPIVLCDKSIPNSENDFHLHLSDDSVEDSISENYGKHDDIPGFQNEFIKPESGDKMLPERKGKTGRPRNRGLMIDNEYEKNKMDTYEEGLEKGRKQDYACDEPRPFKIYTRGKLYHADAEEIFQSVQKKKTDIYKNEVKMPQYGDIYILDKNFVPYSDSLPWVREYYYKVHSVLMERFTLRDSKAVFTYPLPPASKSVFTLFENDLPLCIVHYEKGPHGSGKTVQKLEKSEETKDGVRRLGIYTESNSNLTLSLVDAMLSNPDEKRIASAPILNPQPFQVYLLRLPAEKNSKVIDNYRWTDKGYKRWPVGVNSSETKLLCYHCPMKMSRSAMCTALMRHEFKHTSASPDLRVVHYMPTREFREFIVIANAAKQMQVTTELSREGWENMELESEAPLHVSSTRLKPVMVWDLLTRDASNANITGAVRMEIITPQPGGVYLSTKYDAPDLLPWDELGKLQIQPRLYQIVEVCEKISEAQPYLIRMCYTSPKIPHRVLVHYLGDTRPYLVKECEIVIDDYTGEPSYRSRGMPKKSKRRVFLSADNSLIEEKLYKISTSHMREVGCMPLKLEDLDIEVKTEVLLQQDNQEDLIAPDKLGLYLYGHRMMKKRIIRVMENLDRSRKTQLPIKTPEAGEAYLVTKPSNTKAPIDSYKWTQKGWQPIPRKDPVVLWKWGLLRHKKQTWAPPLIRIDYTHLKVNTDLMLVHYIPTKDNEMMLEIRSAVVTVRTQTHTLLSMGDVNFGQHSQLLTNSPLPPSHIWELLNAGGGLTVPLSEPQPGGVYVINLCAKDKLDLFRWKTLGDIRLSSNDYGLTETTFNIEWEPQGQFARLTYHTPLIKNRTVIHYLGDCRPYLERAKAEEEERQRKLDFLRKKTGDNIEINSIESHEPQLSLPEMISGSRDAATEAVGSILAGLGSNIMDTDTLNQTFAELGGEVEGLCEGRLGFLSSRPEDEHLRDANLPPIDVPFGSVSTTSIVKDLFPEGLPKISFQKILEVEPGEYVPKKRRLDNLVELPDPKAEPKEEDRMMRGSYRAVPRTIEDWNEEEGEIEDGEEGEQFRRTRLQITTVDPRTIVYIRQQENLTEKQIDHMLCNPDVSRISFLPLLEPQPGDVYVVAIPYRKGEVRRMDCYNWYVTGHKKGKYRRTYSYIREEDGNTSHRLLRYTYDYAWENTPGLRVIHYIPGDPRHQVQCVGKKPNYEEEPEGQGCGPLYRAYTAAMTHRDALLIINDPPMYHLCEIPINNPEAGEVYVVKAPSLALGRRELMYDNLTWSEGQVKHVGGKRPVVRKTKCMSVDPEDGTKSDAFFRVTWERMVDLSAVDVELPTTRKKQAYVIIHYLGDETLAGEMVRKGKDGALHLRQIRHYMETGAYLSSVHLSEKNGIRKSAKKFLIEGRTKTLRRLTERYYWTSMVEDIVAMIVRCKTCEFNKLNRPNQRYVRVTEPWEVVSIDIIGQFATSDRGNVFVAVIIDMFTKYTIAVPLRDATVSDLTSVLQTAVYQQGPPRKFLSDQNEDFIKELNSRLELDTGLVGNVVAVNKTQVNRPDEASIKTAILRHCHESGNIWDDLLQRKVYEMNTTHITASGQTPFYLMFHRQVRPMDTNFCLQMSGNGKPTFVVRDIERYMEEREQRANDIINQVLNGQPSQSTIKTSPEDTSNDCVENIPTTTFIDAVQDGNHEYQTSVQVVTDAPGPDQDHAHYTHVAHLSDGQVIQDPGGSVYDMGDGEGHVVVVADGMTGLEEGGEVAGQHMVVVQPGVDQGVIMLSESQVIMEAVDGQQFTYMSQT
ncbi:uncharacterized protein LOC121864994 isoform X2 [Homarus americanus]|uniref:uncharacterized protein LOC121864994 isoform X2 n=1 Tax=Homarus americanus TaxID=6706 RepID=UPI001C4956BE|nr:uncharacterized protein LOC121864994 isoform X2 [Homarus americanus]